MPWSPSDVDRLILLWGEGKSLAAISRALGVSKNAVAAKAVRAGLPKRANQIKAVSVPKTKTERHLRVPVAAMAEAAPVVGPVRVRTCVYIVGKDRDPETLQWKSCGAPLFRRNYCEPHARACFAVYHRLPSEDAP